MLVSVDDDTSNRTQTDPGRPGSTYEPPEVDLSDVSEVPWESSTWRSLGGSSVWIEPDDASMGHTCKQDFNVP